MPQTRMFRDRVVSMEQTLERGEKHLEFLKGLCREVFPEFDYREHSLDHERDLFLMVLEAPDGRRKSVGWTRMVLFDPERLPALIDNSSSPLGMKLKEYLRARASRADIVVTFRHLEEGWIDTPEPRRDKRRRRGRGRPERREGQRPQGSRPQPAGPRPPASPPGRPGPGQAPRPLEAGERPLPPGATSSQPPGREGRRRRRRMRRRRGRGGSGTPGASPPVRTP